MADERDVDGWYSLRLLAGYDTMKAAARMTGVKPPKWVRDSFKEIMAALDARPRGGAMLAITEEQWLVVEKLENGSVIGMVTGPQFWGRTPGEAYAANVDEGGNPWGPTVIRYMTLAKDDSNLVTLH